MNEKTPITDIFVSEFDNEGNSIPPTIFVSFDGDEPREVEYYLETPR